MKNKTLILAGAMCLGFATLANAVQYVYLTGSTAARGVVDTTMLDATGNGVFDSGSSITTVPASGTGSAGQANYRGLLGGADTIIKCSWSGSEGGIADLALGSSENFLSDDGSSQVSSTVDIAMADNAIAYSKNPSAAVTGAKVGIIPFKWVAQKGSAASLVNVTDQAIRQALKANAKLALFTGVSTDTTRVYVSGRDNNSGTRVNALGESFYGIFTAPKQIEVGSNGAMLTNSVDGNIATDWGYSGGGSLASQMGYDLSQATSIDIGPSGDGTSHFSVIAYLGVGDATTAIGNGGRELTLNGVAYSLAAIQEGRYNFWGNEYVYRKNTVSSQASTVYSALASLAAGKGIAGHADSAKLINDSSMMHATRTGPTADPVHK
jgi:hypothetical protein